jgi:diaminopimelate epimerase
MRMLDIVKADPAGNITIFVLGAGALAPSERIEAAKLLLADSELRAEQVGFAAPPAEGGLWRLEMAGGEFCGNAARSFGLFAARESGLAGKQTLFVEASGASRPVPVDVDCDTGEAAAAIDPPRRLAPLDFDGKLLAVYRFDGITHIIADDTRADEAAFFAIKRLLEARDGPPRDAVGVMFYDTAENIMRPAVYVYGTDTLVFESSCGSGSAAFACRLAEQDTGKTSVPIRQPGGTITATVSFRDGAVGHIRVGGPVRLSELRFQLDGGLDKR